MSLSILIKELISKFRRKNEGDCTIYKYTPLDANTISNLINETIYFNQVNNFDDPTDAAFIILTGGKMVNNNNLSEEKIQELYRFIGRKYQNEATDSETTLRLIQVSRALEEALKQYVGISCFSKHNICRTCRQPRLNPLMLTHYAYRHTGIVIEYKCSNPAILKEVNYSPEYRHFNCEDILSNFTPREYPKRIEINNKVISPLLFKFEEWVYQDECRIFSAPNQSQHYSELGLSVNRIFFGSGVKKHISDGLIKSLGDRDIEFRYLRAPICNNDQQRVVICDDTIGSNRLNCSIKCNCPK